MSDVNDNKQQADIKIEDSQVSGSTIVGNVINQNCVFMLNSDKINSGIVQAGLLQKMVEGGQEGAPDAKKDENGNMTVDNTYLALMASCCTKVNDNDDIRIDKDSFRVIKNCTRKVNKRQPVVFISAPSNVPHSEAKSLEFKCAEELKRQLDVRGVNTFWWKSFNSCVEGEPACAWDRNEGQILIGSKINYGLAMSSVFIGFSLEGEAFDKNENCKSELRTFKKLDSNTIAKQFVEFPYDEDIVSGTGIGKSACKLMTSALKKDLPKHRNYYLVSDRSFDGFNNEIKGIVDNKDVIKTVQNAKQLSETKKIEMYVTAALECIWKHIDAHFSSFGKKVLTEIDRVWKKLPPGFLPNGNIGEEGKFSKLVPLQDKKQEIPHEDYKKYKDVSMKIFHDGCNTPSDWFFKYAVIDSKGNDVTIESENESNRHFELFLERDYTSKGASPCVNLCLVVNDWNVAFINKNLNRSTQGSNQTRFYEATEQAAGSGNKAVIKTYGTLDRYGFFTLNENGETKNRYNKGNASGTEAESYSQSPNFGKAYIKRDIITSKKFDCCIKFYNSAGDFYQSRESVLAEEDSEYHIYAVLIKKDIVNYDIRGAGGEKHFVVDTHAAIKRDLEVCVGENSLASSAKLNDNDFTLQAGKSIHPVELNPDNYVTTNSRDLRLRFCTTEEKDNAFTVLRKAPPRGDKKTLISGGKSPLQCIYCAENWPKKTGEGTGVYKNKEGHFVCENNSEVKMFLPEDYAKSQGAVVAMVGAPGAGKSVFISRMFENITVDLDFNSGEDTLVNTRPVIHPVVQRAFENIGIECYFSNNIEGDDNDNSSNSGDLYNSFLYKNYTNSLYKSLAQRTENTASISSNLKKCPFICKIGDDKSGCSYLSFFDLPGGQFTDITKGTKPGDFVCLNSNIWVICVSVSQEDNSNPIGTVEKIVDNLIWLMNLREVMRNKNVDDKDGMTDDLNRMLDNLNRNPQKKPVAVAVVMCKADEFSHEFDANATVNMMSPRVEYRYQGSMLEKYIDECSDEVKTLIRAYGRKKGDELINKIDNNFEFVKYFAVSSLGSKNSVELRKSAGESDSKAYPKYMVNPYGIQNVLAWICYQIGILR